MKTKLLLLMLLFTATAHGQNSYLFRVTDTNLIPKNPLQLNSVNNQLAQTLYNTLSITKFEQAHPKSKYLFRKNIYRITATGNNLFNALQTAFPGKFEYLGAVTNGSPLCYHPDDYSNSVFNGLRQYELDFIRADTAWCYSTGDSNTVIGMTDGYVAVSHVHLTDKIPYI